MAAAVGNLDQITQQHAALVEEPQTASQALLARAAALSAAFDSMRLRQGCADEASALVARAAGLLARLGRQGR